MEFLIGWIITIMISLSMEESFKHHITKDIHDSGYKYILKIKGRNNNQTTNKRRRDLIHYMPFINLIYQLRLVYTYTINKEDFMNEYITKGLIEEMTEEEFNKYKSTKNYNKAIIKLYENSITFTSIQLDDGSNIEYCYKVGDEDINNIVITEVTGPAKNLSDDEIKSEIEKKIQSDTNKILKKLEQHEIKNEENEQEIKNVNIVENNNNEKQKILTKKINRK